MSMMNIIITIVAATYATAEDFASALTAALATLNVGETIYIDYRDLDDRHGDRGIGTPMVDGCYTDEDAVKDALYTGFDDGYLNPRYYRLCLTRIENGAIEIVYDDDEDLFL